MRRWDGMVDGYIRECSSRGLAESTLVGRRAELERLGAWLKRRRPRPSLEEVGVDLLIRYVRDRSLFHSKCMVSSVLSELRGLGDYLVRRGLWRNSPLRWVRGPRLSRSLQLPRRISPEQMTRLWREAASWGDQHLRHRRVAMLAILYGTGLRRGELERLEVANWDSEQGTLTIDGRKTGMERSVPVAASVARCIEAYLPHRQNVLERTGRRGESALLVTRRGDRLRGHQIAAAVRRIARRAKVPAVSCHRFRHSCASDLLERGVALPKIQRILGHSSVSSTMRYTHVADPERRRVMASHPINEMLEGLAVQGGGTSA